MGQFEKSHGFWQGKKEPGFYARHAQNDSLKKTVGSLS
jgi:hypothetical protein